MADVHDKATRSYNMSRIRAKNTSPEILVRKFLYSHGIRYRIHVKNLPGQPDIVIPKLKIAIFVNGCFWHGHEGCKYFVVPKTRTEWWLQKILHTRTQDEENILKLKVLGWKVILIFECDLKGVKRTSTLKKLLEDLSVDFK